MPEQYMLFVREWHLYHPKWQIVAWTEDNLKFRVLQGTELSLYNEAEHIVRGSPWQFRADVARYALLHKFGGVYLDVDTQPRKPIDELCEVSCWLGWESQDEWIGNAYIGARRGHPFMYHLLNGLPDSVRQHSKQARANVISGPQYVTQRMQTYNGPPVHIYPQHMLYPYSFSELHRGGEVFVEAHAVHHWNNQRKRKKVPL